MFVTLEQTDVAELHQFRDPVTGLRALIAIHSTRLGPALGGCRFLPYPDEFAAETDVCRLARGMSYKAALAGLSLGGGKAVIMEPEKPYDRHALFQRFGRAVETLNGRYITAMDAGTEITDLDQIGTQTRHVIGCSRDGIDPSPFTALGVYTALQVTCARQLHRQDFNGLHVAIQGLGHVGRRLAMMLSWAGARLTITDTDQERGQTLANRLGAEFVAPERIYDVPCDAFMPCALGGVLNADTISRLDTRLIVGAANNQLASSEDARHLQDRHILYTPDYVNNAGGLIALALHHQQQGNEAIRRKVKAIGRTLANLISDAERLRVSPAIMADRMAEQRLHKAHERAA